MKPEVLPKSQGRSGFLQSIRTGLRSTVARNAASLYLIEFANYIVPLVTVPYLVRVLGPAGYGAVAFAQGFINYLVLLVEYGFDWSVTRHISVQRDPHKTLNNITVHVWAAKGLLSLLGLGVLLFLIAFVQKMKEVALLLLALYGIVLGNVLFPKWLFQGMERMVAISAINLGVKIGVLVGVFALVHRPEDTVIYAALMGGGFLAAGLVGAIAAMRMFNLKFSPVTWLGIWETLKEGWLFFLTKASISLYTGGNAFVLGMLTSHTMVGYYSVAEKVVKTVLAMLGPLSQSAYPRFSKLASESVNLALHWGRRMLVFMGASGLVVSVLVFAYASLIVMALFGSEYKSSIPVMRILSGLIVLIALSDVLGVQILFSLHYEKYVFRTVSVAGIMNVGLAVILVPLWGEKGMAWAVTLSELFVTVSYLAVVIYKERGFVRA